MGCPICKNNNYSHSFYINDYEYNPDEVEEYLTCSSCHCIYRKKEINVEREKLLYAKNIYKPVKGGNIYDFLKKINAYYEKVKILKYILKGKTNKKISVLDIACGKGYLITQLSKRQDLKCFGIDINVENKKNKIEFIKSSYKDIEVIRSINADTIILNNFIEHVEDLKYLYNIINIMKKDSNMVIITPDTQSNGRYFFKNCWSGYHSPRHKILFNNSNILKAFNIIKGVKLKTYKIYDPFTNLISIINLYKKLRINYSTITMLKLIISPIFIFTDIINKNRIVIIIEKNK